VVTPAVPRGLPGIESGVSTTRVVAGVGADAGAQRRWHLLDTASVLEREGISPVGTIVAVQHDASDLREPDEAVRLRFAGYPVVVRPR